MSVLEALARIKSNKLQGAAGRRFFDVEHYPDNAVFEPNIKLTD